MDNKYHNRQPDHRTMQLTLEGVCSEIAQCNAACWNNKNAVTKLIKEVTKYREENVRFDEQLGKINLLISDMETYVEDHIENMQKFVDMVGEFIDTYHIEKEARLAFKRHKRGEITDEDFNTINEKYNNFLVKKDGDKNKPEENRGTGDETSTTGDNKPEHSESGIPDEPGDENIV